MNYCSMIIKKEVLYFPPRYINGRGISLNSLKKGIYCILGCRSSRPIKFLERMKVKIELL